MPWRLFSVAFALQSAGILLIGIGSTQQMVESADPALNRLIPKIFSKIKHRQRREIESSAGPKFFGDTN
jgi:hypothetical protein